MNPLKQAAYAKLDARPETLDDVCDHIANGGSLVTLAELWKLRYSDVVSWLYEVEHADRKERYERSLRSRDEWGIERLLHELRSIAFVDLRAAFDDEGRLKPLGELPQAVAAALAGMETFEEYAGVGAARAATGRVRKVKFSDKLKALELLGKQLKLFVDRHEVTETLTLEQLVGGSWGKDGPPKIRTGETHGAEPRGDGSPIHPSQLPDHESGDAGRVLPHAAEAAGRGADPASSEPVNQVPPAVAQA